MSTADALLLDEPEAPEAIAGVIIGLVSKTSGDPDGLNRVQVDFPTLDIGSAWARVASFAAGPNKGVFWLPAEKDEVLVAFEMGDPSRPYVIGALWNGVDKPPVPEDSIQTIREMRTASGSLLRFDDADGGTAITLADKNGNTVRIDTKNDTVSITAKKNIEISAPDGSVTIKAGSVSISATESGLTLKSTANATLSADGETIIKGSVINLN